VVASAFLIADIDSPRGAWLGPAGEFDPHGGVVEHALGSAEVIRFEANE
jgi:hypothetical protein